MMKQLLHIAVLALILLTHSCRDMEEYVFDAQDQQAYLSSEAELIISLKEAYSKLYPVMEHLYFLQEVSSDEMIIPPRRGQGVDSEQWMRLHRHTYVGDEKVLEDCWAFLQEGLTACDDLLKLFAEQQVQGTNTTALTAEVKVLKALFLWWSIDLFGQVPSFEQNRLYNSNDRTSIYNYCVDVIEEEVAHLSKAVDATTYGRVNYWVAKMLQAKLYLNAIIYTGQQEWEKAEAALSEVVYSELFTLEPDYFNGFAVHNDETTEMILAIPYDREYAKGFRINYLAFAESVMPGSGLSLLPDFYRSFEKEDVRWKGLHGGENTDFSIDITFNRGMVNFYQGTRLAKFEQFPGAIDMSNDFPLFRYADALLMYAEARWHQNTNDERALAIVNDIRNRAELSPLTRLNAENLLEERAHELYGEMHRRTDLIRFGRYGASWWEKPADISPHLRIFPIPVAALKGKNGAVQNPAY